MDVVLAKPRGFCAGVKRAITVVEQALTRYGSPVFVLHEIVHNTRVISELEGQGAIFVERLEDIPAGSVTIFSAHGVSLAVEKRAHDLDLRTIDATCPLVSRVHRRVMRLNSKGYDVLVIGHRGHPEVEGTCGHASGAVHVVSCAGEVADLQVADSGRVGYVTQTTLSIDETENILGVIREQFPDISEPERTDICYATTNRQNAVRELAGRVDMVLVVGSKNSSNSNRLREVADLRGVSAYLIDRATEIDPAWMKGVKSVGVTAGASAPEELVQEVTAWLKQHCRDKLEILELPGDDENVTFHVPEFKV